MATDFLIDISVMCWHKYQGSSLNAQKDKHAEKDLGRVFIFCPLGPNSIIFDKKERELKTISSKKSILYTLKQQCFDGQKVFLTVFT